MEAIDTYEKLKREDSPLCCMEGPPRKSVLYFSDGTLEIDEDDEMKQVKEESSIDPQKLSWAPWMWYYTTFAGSKALEVCDYFGEFFAAVFGITTPKYQYEITEYNRIKKEEEERTKESDFAKTNGWSDGGFPSVSIIPGTPNSCEKIELDSIKVTTAETI